jgi:DNA-binding transcriptional LysR family regulator
MDLRRLRSFVAVAEELRSGRAAVLPAGLVRELEEASGRRLFERSEQGVRLTQAGEVLLGEARERLGEVERELAERARGRRTLVVGTVAGAGFGPAAEAVAAYRRAHPEVEIRLREADLTDPTAGLHSGKVDLALTRLPFDTTGLAVHPLGGEPLVAALSAGDPLTRRPGVRLAELAARPWIQLPESSDPAWRRFWLGAPPLPAPAGPVVRTVPECLHAIVWQRAVGLLPRGVEQTHRADGIRFVPVIDHPLSQAVLAWSVTTADPDVLALTETVAAAVGFSA